MSFQKVKKVYNNSMTVYTHRHHQLPTNAPYLPELHEFKEDWTVDLTVEGHACQHDILYKVFGWEGDRIAAQGLSGIIGHEEAHRQACILGGKTTSIEQLREMGRRGSRTRKELGHYGLGHCHVQPVIAVNKETLEETWFPSQKAAADALNVIPNHISEIVRNIGTRKSSRGYVFRRAS
jgi:hypothetical protein